MDGSWIFILAFDLLIAYLMAKHSSKKGYNGICVGIFGFFFPIIYLIFLCMPNKNKEEDVSKTNEKKKVKSKSKKKSEDNSSGLIIFGVVIVIVLFIILILVNSGKFSYDEFKDYTGNVLIFSYDQIESNYGEKKLSDGRIYIKDLYDLYNKGVLNDALGFSEPQVDGKTFADVYEENSSEYYNDYVIVVRDYDEEQYQWFYFEEFSEKEELAEYIVNIAIDNYEKKITNNFEISVQNEIVYLEELYENDCIESEYFKKLYKKLVNEIKDDYVEVISEGGKIYQANYEYSV